LRWLLVSVVVCSLVLTGCSSTVASEEEGGEETYHLVLNSSQHPPYFDWEPKYYAVEAFTQLVEERTNNQVTFDIYYSNQLAGQRESADALARGTYDMQEVNGAFWTERIPELYVVSLMFWNYGEEHTLHMMRNTEFGELYEQSLEDYGIKLMHFWPASVTGYMSSTPLASMSDMNGLIMNQTSNLAMDYHQQVGAGIATMPTVEQYEGLMRGTLDAIQFPFYSLETYRYVEVVDYISLPTLNPAISMVTINQDSWDELPEDIQEIMIETSQEVEMKAAEASKAMTERAFEFANENDVTCVAMDREDFESMRSAVKTHLWGKYASINERTERMVEVLEEETERWLEENPEFKQYFDPYLTDYSGGEEDERDHSSDESNHYCK